MGTVKYRVLIKRHNIKSLRALRNELAHEPGALFVTEICLQNLPEIPILFALCTFENLEELWRDKGNIAQLGSTLTGGAERPQKVGPQGSDCQFAEER